MLPIAVRSWRCSRLNSAAFYNQAINFSLIKVYPENKKKETSPDFFGSAKLKGVEMRLSALQREQLDIIFPSA